MTCYTGLFGEACSAGHVLNPCFSYMLYTAYKTSFAGFFDLTFCQLKDCSTFFSPRFNEQKCHQTLSGGELIALFALSHVPLEHQGTLLLDPTGDFCIFLGNKLPAEVGATGHIKADCRGTQCQLCGSYRVYIYKKKHN